MCFPNPTANFMPSRQDFNREGLTQSCESTQTIDIWETVQPDSHVKAIELEPCGDGSGKVEVLNGDILTIGRSGDENQHNTTDKKMSRRHFTIRCDENRGLLCDLASTNGTLLNGIPVDKASVYDGDQITAGTTSFQVRFVIE